MFTLIYPVYGLDWLWLGIAVLADISAYAAGARRGAGMCRTTGGRKGDERPRTEDERGVCHPSFVLGRNKMSEKEICVTGAFGPVKITRPVK